MKCKLFFAIVFLSFCFNLSSQISSFDRYWYFGLNAWDWSSGSPVAVSGCALTNIEGCNTVNDVGGNLQFYGGDDKIYNKNNTLMPNSVGLLANITPKQGPIAVQVPNFSNRFYYIYPQGFGGTLRYSTIDMTLQGGLGDVMPASKNIQLRPVVAEGILAIPKSTACNEYWLLTHGVNSNFLC